MIPILKIDIKLIVTKNRVNIFNLAACQRRNTELNPQAPVAQKIADEVVFRHFQGEGVEFFF